jgi:transposase
VDRGKNGSKHHLLVDGRGTPLSATLTGANRHDVTQLLPLVDGVPPVPGRPGRPRRRFDRIQGDRAYGSDPHRRQLQRRGSQPLLAQRMRPHGSGLGKYRWPVERSLGWMHQNRRLRVRYEKRADVHEALMLLAEVKMCWDKLHRRRRHKKKRFC